MWYDDRQRMWILCDGCDGPVFYDLAFFPPTQRRFEAERVRAYCALCAAEILSDWWLTLVQRNALIAARRGS